MSEEDRTGKLQLERQCEVWMLNVRFALIALVFLASGIEPVIGRFGTLHALYTWIYMFHMPLFAFVTGYFARPNLLGRKGNGVLQTVAVQYVIFQTLYTAADLLFFHSIEDRPSFFLPFLMLWFLLAHFGWRCALRVMAAMRIKHPIFWSAVLGVAIGYWDGNGSWLSLSRMFVFLPFFTAGYAVHPSRILALYNGWLRKAMGSASLALLAVIPFLAWESTPDWLYGKFTYSEMGVAGVHAGLARFGGYLLQAASGAAFLALISRRASKWTDMGSRALYVFLLHGLFVRSWIRMDVYEEIRDWIGIGLLFAVIVGLTIMLAMPQIRSLTRWLIEPDIIRYAAWIGRFRATHRKSDRSFR